MSCLSGIMPVQSQYYTDYNLLRVVDILLFVEDCRYYLVKKKIKPTGLGVLLALQLFSGHIVHFLREKDH